MSIAKDVLPWALLVISFVFGSGVRQSQFDQQKQQAEEARAAMREMRQQIIDLTNQQAVLATKVDMLIQHK